MTSQLQQAIQMMQSLSSVEQVELLKLLSGTVQQTHSLEEQNKHFWRSRSVDKLIQEQQPPIFVEPSSLTVDFWDSNESTDEFLTFLRQQRSIEPIETL
ncbi:MAG: hypothetical protein KME27_15890 [Lyngbya sp. HA4199-MV5]|nr:hypothetical protein [Lyngbya sp. HA4199-MV5]